MESIQSRTQQEPAPGPVTLVPPGDDAVMPSRSAEESSTALGTPTQNIAGAAQTVQYENLQFALLLGNDRNDDGPQLQGAAGESQVARSFLNLFEESFTAFKQSVDYQLLLGGQATPWRPVLRDANGKLIGGFPTVLLNPTPGNPGQQPVIQIVLPQHDWLSQVPAHHQASITAQKTNQPLTFLDRRPALGAQEALARQLGDDAGQAARISEALLTRTTTYDPLSPAAFTLTAAQFEPTLGGQPFGWLTELFPLYRVNVSPALTLVSAQRIDERAYERSLEQYPSPLSQPQQLALLRGDQLGDGQQTLTYNSLTGSLVKASLPLLIRGYSRDTEQLLTRMLTLEHTQLGGTPDTVPEEAFVAGYQACHHKTDQYDPTDPVAYYDRLKTVFQGGLGTQSDPQQTQQAIGRLMQASQQYSQLVRVQTVNTVKEALTVAVAKAPLPTETLRELLSTNLTPINERVLFDQHQGLRAYKGVSLQPDERKALLRGERLELSGLQDGRRGSLYRASITLDAVSGQPQERKAGQGEQLLTDKPVEAAAHSQLTGGQAGTTAEPTRSQTAALRTAPNPTEATRPRPRH